MIHWLSIKFKNNIKRKYKFGSLSGKQKSGLRESDEQNIDKTKILNGQSSEIQKSL